MTRSKEQILEDYLVAAAKTGDRSAMGQLARLRGPRLLAHATRLMGEPEAARDVVQTAWVDILRGLRGINLVGMDMVEVSPPYDHADITSLLGAFLAYDMIALYAARHKLGETI